MQLEERSSGNTLFPSMVDMNTTSRYTRFLGAALLAAALPLGLTACSSHDSASGASSTAEGVGAKWSACMRDSGFDVTDVSDDEARSGAFRIPEGADSASFTERAQQCSGEVGIEGASDEQQQQWDREYAAVASCIRENGYDDFPEQKDGVISTNGYPRASEAHFDEVFHECLAEYAPDTKTRG